MKGAGNTSGLAPLLDPEKGTTMTTFDDYIANRLPEAWALLRKGGFSARIARAFLIQHGAI